MVVGSVMAHSVPSCGLECPYTTLRLQPLLGRSQLLSDRSAIQGQGAFSLTVLEKLLKT